MVYRLHILFLLAALAWRADGQKRCYTCTTSNPPPGDPCVEDPANVMVGSSITPCTKKYCTIFRQELTEEKGNIRSFSRGCVDRLDKPDGVYENAHFIEYLRSCQTDLCNIGDGTKSLNDGAAGGGGGGLMGDEEGAGACAFVVCVPGKNGNADTQDENLLLTAAGGELKAAATCLAASFATVFFLVG
ncbi:unnamed protein product [Darwinula stevensoni]|uniref:Sodefrin-like factor n=1 Tax=Darwinula stevensoni TaxID=69355 RepID=A0A7R8XJS3_9CRUS|nr:unnamed protein product [Darwinula stevensoni]CAG0894495.1 unnamed protein product [Darwinula stevensoni]